jgi:hypothetical protein
MRRPQLRRGFTTVRLQSGLGNQLFQYAFGRAVAERTRTKLRFDLSYFGLEPHRGYALGDFHIRATLHVAEPRTEAEYRERDAEAEFVMRRFKARILRENGLDFDPGAIGRATKNTYLAGYWQAEGYFAEVAELIRKELTPRPTERIRRGLAQIAGARCAVAVHVRRGDLVENPDMTAKFGVTGAEFFAPAAEEMLREHPTAEFFVFSDDPEWCARELRLPGPTTLMSGGNAPFEDLALIASCDHAIISSSTFGWWGAWLGEHPGQLVIAPAIAFPGSKSEPSGMIPERWRRL